MDKKDSEYEPALTALLEVLGVNSEPAANWMSTVKITSEEFKKPLLSRKEPVVDGTSALLSSLWFDDLVNLRELKITDRNTTNFYKDGFLHLQYCIGARGIDSFKHLFAAKNSMENAKNLLMEDVDFFKLFRERNEIPSTDRLTISCEEFRKLAYLKSVLNDASVNYSDASSVLACWRGIVGEDGKLGSEVLTEIEKAHLISEVNSSFPPPFSDKMEAYRNYILGPKTPSKDPEFFKLFAAYRSPQLTTMMKLKGKDSAVKRSPEEPVASSSKRMKASTSDEAISNEAISDES